jgi:hypothetical protein
MPSGKKLVSWRRDGKGEAKKKGGRKMRRKLIWLFLGLGILGAVWLVPRIFSAKLVYRKTSPPATTPAHLVVEEKASLPATQPEGEKEMQEKGDTEMQEGKGDLLREETVSAEETIKLHAPPFVAVQQPFHVEIEIKEFEGRDIEKVEVRVGSHTHARAEEEMLRKQGLSWYNIAQPAIRKQEKEGERWVATFRNGLEDQGVFYLRAVVYWRAANGAAEESWSPERKIGVQ